MGDDRPAPVSQEQPSFGSLLRRLRLQARLTQEVLAERAGVSVATIGALEEERRRQPYPHTVAALAEALRLSGDERAALEAASADDRSAGAGAARRHRERAEVRLARELRGRGLLAE